MAERQLTQEYVRSLFEYAPETGVLTWKERPIEHFATEQSWRLMNKRCAGKVAGSSHAGEGSYLAICLKGTKYLVHRLIWLHVHGEEPDEVDHLNGVRNDNRISNLRNVSRSENMKNKRLSNSNKSGVTGVVWHKAAGKWVAQIRVSGQQYHLGVFETVEEAANVRAAAQREHCFFVNHGR